MTQVGFFFLFFAYSQKICNGHIISWANFLSIHLISADILFRYFISASVPQYMAQFLIQISYLRLCSPINVAISRHVTGINAPLPFHNRHKIFAKSLAFEVLRALDSSIDFVLCGLRSHGVWRLQSCSQTGPLDI